MSGRITHPSFWMVVNINGSSKLHPPVVKHSSYEHAEHEAQRMAEANKGQQFVVLCSIRGWVVREPVPVLETVEVFYT